MKFLLILGSILLLGPTMALAQQNASMSLAGTWRFQLDREDAGVEKQWWRQGGQELREKVKLPGCIQEQGFGDEPSADTKWTSGIGAALLKNPKYAPYREKGSFKTPFWLTPTRYYVGPAWFQRDVEIPQGWANRRIILNLERCHWQTMLWVDGKEIGSRDALGVAHEYDVTSALSPGRHSLTLRVDNRVKIPVGVDAHSVSDQTQGNWNGIVGNLSLRAESPLWLDNVQIYPDVAARKVRLSMEIRNLTGVSGSGTLKASARSFNSPREHVAASKQWPIRWNAEPTRVEVEYELGPDAQQWDEFSPALYRLQLQLDPDGSSASDTRTLTFGLRQLATSGTQFTMNGRPIFLRGTLECCIFPKTGYPPTDVESWKKILSAARAHGLNHLRFHSWCPPEAAFVAADEMGFYYQVEVSCWATFGEGTPVDKWVAEEADRMVRAYGNHPSFTFMVPSNEPGGKNREAFLGNLIASWAAKDSRRMYTAGSGWPSTPQNQYLVTFAPRMHATNELTRPPQTSADYRDFINKTKIPVIAHETGQWCVYPNFDEIPKYTGYLRPGNLQIFQDFLNKSGMGHQAKDLLVASGKFQTLLYKEEIEATMRTPGMAGIQLLDLHDFPGQGTAPIGVLDAFWEQKGYVKPEEYRRFCGQTVPLARLSKRIFTSDEPCSIEADIAHFGPKNLADSQVEWRVRQDGRTITQGEFASRDIPTGRLSTLGSISVPLNSVKAPAKLNLEISIAGTEFANDWDFWVYPPQVSTAAGPDLRIAETLSDDVLDALKKGGKVLLLPGPSRIAGDTYGTFQPIFWNRITFPRQKIHTLGILCDPKHPALRAFPTENHSNWQWWDIQQYCTPMVLDSLPRELPAIVQMIDDWDVCRRLALVTEARVGEGKLLLCSIDLRQNLEQRLAARQLLRSLLDYMASDAFAPAVQLTPEQVNSLFREPNAMQKLGARIIRASSEQPGFPASNIIDSDPMTMWHTIWGDAAPRFPHEVIVGFEQDVKIAGCRLLPRQDANRNGFIRTCEIYASADGKQWGAPAAKASFERNSDVKVVRFEKPVECRFLRIVAIEGFDNQPFASLAELEIITAASP